jgi:hypothetical protein
MTADAIETDPIAAARREAERIVRDAQDQAWSLLSSIYEGPGAPAAGLKPIARSRVSAEAFRDDQGVVWLRLGDVPEVPDEPMEEVRRCVKCRGVKPLSRFRPDGNTGRSRRKQCRDCENQARRDSDAKKRVSRGEIR